MWWSYSYTTTRGHWSGRSYEPSSDVSRPVPSRSQPPSSNQPSCCGIVTRERTNRVVAGAGQNTTGDARSLVVLPTDDARRVEGEGVVGEGVEGVERWGDRVVTGHVVPVTGCFSPPLVLLLVELSPLSVSGSAVVLAVSEVSAVEVSPEGRVCGGLVEVSVDRGEGQERGDIQQSQDPQ